MTFEASLNVLLIACVVLLAVGFSALRWQVVQLRSEVVDSVARRAELGPIERRTSPSVPTSLEGLGPAVLVVGSSTCSSCLQILRWLSSHQSDLQEDSHSRPTIAVWINEPPAEFSSSEYPILVIPTAAAELGANVLPFACEIEPSGIVSRTATLDGVGTLIDFLSREKAW